MLKQYILLCRYTPQLLLVVFFHEIKALSSLGLTQYPEILSLTVLTDAQSASLCTLRPSLHMPSLFKHNFCSAVGFWKHVSQYSTVLQLNHQSVQIVYLSKSLGLVWCIYQTSEWFPVLSWIYSFFSTFSVIKICFTHDRTSFQISLVFSSHTLSVTLQLTTASSALTFFSTPSVLPAIIRSSHPYAHDHFHHVSLLYTHSDLQDSVWNIVF